MKKNFIFFILIFSQSVFAEDAIGKLWIALERVDARLAAMQTQIFTLQNQFFSLQNQMASLQRVPKKIGDEYHGGIIFYVDESGQHGLIASKSDVTDEGIEWRNGVSGNKVTNARSDGVGAGVTNTRLIIASQTIDNQRGQFAALVAANFQVLSDGVTPCKTPLKSGAICYSGWYLPSAFELQLLHNNLYQNNLSTFEPQFYWSSTEAGVSTAWLINFATGEMSSSNKSATLGRVRAISQF